jgi:RNase H-fold protein (predicted Holliday junction resolvase)
VILECYKFFPLKNNLVLEISKKWDATTLVCGLPFSFLISSKIKVFFF